MINFLSKFPDDPGLYDSEMVSSNWDTSAGESGHRVADHRLRIPLTLAQESEDRGGTVRAVSVNDFLHKASALTGFPEILNTGD